MLKTRVESALGFTLLEMIVTMGVFAILVAVGVPSMQSWIRNSQVRAVADGLQNGLRLAQAESLRRSRQVVFALTNNSTPQGALPLPASATGSYWAIYTIPSMTDGSEPNNFVDGGVLGSVSSAVTVTGSTAAVCFNSVGRLIANGSSGVTNVTGGQTCAPPNANPPNPPTYVYNIALAGADHPLQVQLGLGGQVHMCDPSKAIANSPDGC